jgi:hypothetical protein
MTEKLVILVTAITLEIAVHWGSMLRLTVNHPGHLSVSAPCPYSKAARLSDQPQDCTNSDSHMGANN